MRCQRTEKTRGSDRGRDRRDEPGRGCTRLSEQADGRRSGRAVRHSRTASRSASRFGFCQPVSSPFGPVQIAASPMNTGVISLSDDLHTDFQKGCFPLHGEADGASQRDIGRQVLAPELAGQRAPPGHGRAIVARVSRSSLA